MREHTLTYTCEGNLASCTTCKGAEGSLTTECCGRPITEEEVHRIYEVGDLDFVDGKWRTKNNT